MELMYPISIVICVIVVIVIVLTRYKSTKYTQGKLVANTQYIKETEYYKSKMKKYKILSNLIKIFSIICIITASILIARPVKIQNKSEDKYNRDIILGLDISTSESEVNLELINQFRKIIPSIEGDRIGIVLYNTAPVVYCPLTDDYEYIYECIDKIEKQLKLVIQNNNSVKFSFDQDGIEMQTFWYGGTIANYEEKGSSLVGDGLARNTIFISKFEE